MDKRLLHWLRHTPISHLATRLLYASLSLYASAPSPPSMARDRRTKEGDWRTQKNEAGTIQANAEQSVRRSFDDILHVCPVP